MNEYSLPPIIPSFNIHVGHSPLLRVKLRSYGSRTKWTRTSLSALYHSSTILNSRPCSYADARLREPRHLGLLPIGLSALAARRPAAGTAVPGPIVPFASSSESACAWVLVLATSRSSG